MVHLISWYILTMSTVFSVFSWDLCCAGLVLGWRDFSPSSASVISCFWVVSEVQACLKVQYLYIIEPKILDTRKHLLSLHSLLQFFPGIPTPHCFFNLVGQIWSWPRGNRKIWQKRRGPQPQIHPQNFAKRIRLLKVTVWMSDDVGMSKSCGDGSKPWYLVNPKIAGKWMFIPLKMYL